MKGREKQRLYVVRTIEDGQRIDKALKTAKSVVVTGTGVMVEWVFGGFSN